MNSYSQPQRAWESFVGSRVCMFMSFLIIVFLTKYPTLDFPFLGDDAKFWNIPKAFWVAQHGFYPIPWKGLPRELDIDHPHHPWMDKEIRGADHPPLNYELLAVLYAIFGCSHRAFHGAFLFLGALTLYFTYLLGKKMFDSNTGLFAALMLFFSPLFFAQIPELNDDVPTMLFSVITAYAYITGSLCGYLVAGTCLTLSKESGLIVILVILIHAAMKENGWRMLIHRKVKKLICERRLYVYVIPLIIFLGWMIWHFCEKGWALYIARHYPANLCEYLNDLRHVAHFVFLSQGRFLFIPGFIFLLAASRARLSKTQRQTIWLLAGFVTAFTAFYASFDVFYHMRYYLVLFPFFYVVGALSIRLLFKKWALAASSVLAICVIFSSYWHLNPEMEEANICYHDVLMVKRAVSDYLQDRFPGRRIWVEEFYYLDLAYPYVGYVKESLNVLLIPPKGTEFHYQPSDLLLESLSPGWLYELNDLHGRIALLPKRLVTRFQIGREYTNIYLLQ